jgi:hypothetical protein
MGLLIAPSSQVLAARYAELTLPPDPAELAPLCAASIDALRIAEQRIERLEGAVAFARRIGIAIGVVMMIEHVTVAVAEHKLRDRGRGLRAPLRVIAQQFITGGRTTPPGNLELEYLAAATAS